MPLGYLTQGRSQEFFYSFRFAEVSHAKSLLLCGLRFAASESGLCASAIDSLRPGECAGRPESAQGRSAWPPLRGMPLRGSAHDSGRGCRPQWACGPSLSLKTILGRFPEQRTPFAVVHPTASSDRRRDPDAQKSGRAWLVWQLLSRFAARFLTFHVFACPTLTSGPGEISSWWTAGAGELRRRGRKTETPRLPACCRRGTNSLLRVSGFSIPSQEALPTRTLRSGRTEATNRANPHTQALVRSARASLRGARLRARAGSSLLEIEG